MTNEQMIPVDDGGPAFPCDNIVERDARGRLHGFEKSSAGASLRDYFASNLSDEPGDADYGDKVKAALVGRDCPSLSGDGALAVMAFEAEFRAKWRYLRAEAMIRARAA